MKIFNLSALLVFDAWVKKKDKPVNDSPTSK